MSVSILRHLFPADVTFTGRGGPGWFAETHRLPEGARGRRAVVVWGSIADLTKTEDLFGLLLVNSRDASDNTLRRTGFHHVRRFAVLPTLRNARWLIPLDSRRIASGAFRLHTPYRTRARAQHTAGRMLAELGIRFYRDSIVVAQRSTPPVESRVHDVLATDKVRLAFTSGTPGGHPKPTFLVVDRDGHPIAFGKLGASALRRTAARREADALSHLGSIAGGAEVAPRLMFAGEVDESYMTIQAPLTGPTGPAELSTAHRNFLDVLDQKYQRPVGASEFVRALEDRIKVVQPARPDVGHAMARVGPCLMDLVAPSVITHGDFAPWNLRQRDGRIAAFDWEWWSLDGPPLIDQLHHKLQVGFLLQNWTVERACAAVRALAATRPHGLQPDAVYVISTLGVVDYLLRIVEDGYSDRGLLAIAYRELLARILQLVPTNTPVRGANA